MCVREMWEGGREDMGGGEREDVEEGEEGRVERRVRESGVEEREIRMEDHVGSQNNIQQHNETSTYP